MTDLKPGWERVRFGDVVRQVKEKVDPETSGLTRYVAGEHMDTDDLRIRRWGEIGDGYLGPAFHMRFKPGHVLYGSRRTYLRKVAVPDFEGICANTTFVLESADPGVLVPELLPFVMRTGEFHEHSRRESKGSVNPYVNFSDLAWYEFALPPLPEQRRMASALAATEQVAQCCTSLGESLLALATGYSATAFRGQNQLRTDYHPKLGSVTAAWPVVSLGSVTEASQYGLSLAPNTSGDYPILRMVNLVDGRVEENDLRFVDLPHKQFEDYRLEIGDILFNRTNSIELVGRTGIYALAGDHVFASYLVRLRVRIDVVRPEYVTAYLNAPLGRQQVLSFATKAVSQANVSASNLAKVLMPLPPLEWQDRILADLQLLNIANESACERGISAKQQQRALIAYLSGGKNV